MSAKFQTQPPGWRKFLVRYNARLLETGFIVQTEAQKLRGRMQFSESQIYGRTGKRCIACPRDFASRRRTKISMRDATFLKRFLSLTKVRWASCCFSAAFQFKCAYIWWLLRAWITWTHLRPWGDSDWHLYWNEVFLLWTDRGATTFVRWTMQKTNHFRNWNSLWLIHFGLHIWKIACASSTLTMKGQNSVSWRACQKIPLLMIDGSGFCWDWNTCAYVVLDSQS